MLNTQIKASQITNLTDARYFAAWGIDWMGFDLEEGSDHFIAPAELKAIKEWIEGPKIIGEFGMQSAEHIKSLADQLKLDGVQVGPFFPAEDLPKLEGVPIIQKIVIDPKMKPEAVEALLIERAPAIALFLLDFSANGMSWSTLKSGNAPISKAEIEAWAGFIPLIMDLDFKQGDVQQILDLGIVGLAFKGGEEEKVGFKSFEDLNDIFEALETE